MEWEEYEKKCDEIREENRRYLEIFAEDLKGLSTKTIRTHLGNVDFYINVYLPREDALSMESGVDYIDSVYTAEFERSARSI